MSEERAIVICKTCGTHKDVDIGKCIYEGWPKHCGVVTGGNDHCPVCDELIGIGDGFNGEEYECCGRVLVWTRFPGGSYALIERAEAELAARDLALVSADLTEIAAHPESVLRGPALDAKMKQWES